jgi:hypothetical protein
MTRSRADQLVNGQPSIGDNDKERQVTGTGTPAEDMEEEGPQYDLWSLVEDAKWGNEIETQKKAIRDLARMGMVTLPQLKDILSVIEPGEIKQYCQNAMDRLSIRRDEHNI